MNDLDKVFAKNSSDIIRLIAEKYNRLDRTENNRARELLADEIATIEQFYDGMNGMMSNTNLLIQRMQTNINILKIKIEMLEIELADSLNLNFILDNSPDKSLFKEIISKLPVIPKKKNV
jgi:Tfp pilus assembly protein PilE